MKKLLFFFFLTLISSASIAKQMAVKGTVFDKKNNQAMPFVGIMLLQNDSLIKGAMADDKGHFLLDNLENGNYELKISFIGYQPFQKKFTLSEKKPNVHLDPIYLSEDATVLQDFELLTQGSQMKFEVDKKVFSVDQSIANAGGSVSEVLENVPSVEVDAEGNISLRNSTNVEVWINGKPSGLTEENRAQILEQMPAGSVESIELITNPSAKYSPEGTAGIINLVLKKDRKAGYYGNATTGVIVPSRSKIGQLAGINLNFNKGKVDAYFNLGFRNWWHIHEGVTNRYYLSAMDTTETLHQDKYYIHNIRGVNGRFGLNYQINDKHSIGISGFGQKGRGLFDEWMGYEIKDSANTVTANYDRKVYENGDRTSGNTTLDYGWKIDKKGSELRSSLSYAFFMHQREANYLQTVNAGVATTLDQIQQLNGFNNSLHFKTDWIKKFNENNKLESGVDIKTQFRNSYTDAANKIGNNYIDVPSIYNSYDYGEDIYALYGTYGSKIKKVRFQGGLRAEKTTVTTNSTDASSTTNNVRENFQLFPSAFIAYNITKKDELQLNYTRRIDRPKGRRLNPFRDYSDSTNIQYGNPLLKPEFTSAFELNYLKTYGKNNQQMISSSAYYRFTENVIQQIRFLNSGVINTTYMNVTEAQSSGFEFISKNSIARFLNLTSTVNIYYYYLNPSFYELLPSQTIQIDGNESFSWNARMIANMLFSKTFSGQITGKYASAKAVAQGETEANYTVDLGIRKSFFDRKVNLALSVRDVLNTRVRITKTSADDFWQYDEFATIGPTVTLNLTYNFGANGNKKNGKKTEDTNGNNEPEMEDF